MRLLIGLYSESNPERLSEIALCLEHNIEQFSQVVVFLEDECVESLFNLQAPNLVLVPLGHRLTFAEALSYPAKPGTQCVLANNDILFDSSIPEISEHDFWCLTRREADGRFPPCPEMTQDAWVWKAPTKRLCNIDFPLGVPGCDNRIAYEAEQAGYHLRNLCSRVRVMHCHKSGVRRPLTRLVGGYTFVPVEL